MKATIWFVLLVCSVLEWTPFLLGQRQSNRRRTNRRRDCRPTSADIYGPYYRPGFPRLQSFCRRDAAKSRRNNLEVYGHVFESNCRTPIPKARIEIWQADLSGKYEGTSRCRGYIETNNNGFYRFNTVFPGKYKISMEEARDVAKRYNRPIGDRFRPAHIHFKVNGRRGHKSLVSQMYFVGDDHLGWNDSCVICNSDSSDLVVRPRRVCRNNRCRNNVRFDIVLSRGDGTSVTTGR